MGLTKNSMGNNLLVDDFDVGCGSDKFIVGLFGNPNVGKSSVFNGITGLHQHTGNWTGKTIESSVGEYVYEGKNFVLVDLPGTYSLSSYSEEELVATDFIKGARFDVMVVVVDATCLERNLNLVLQILELTRNVVVCVNLMDEARKKNIVIDLEKMEELLGVPVVGTVAMKKKSLESLKCKVLERCNSKTNEVSDFGDDEDIVVEAERIAECVVHKSGLVSKGERFDRILTSKRYGIPIMIAMLGVIFWVTIVGANYPTVFLSWVFEKGKAGLESACNVLGFPLLLKDMLINGVYQTVTWIISVMLPPMAIFFPMFTLLEDLGVLPRIAFNLDNFFRRAGTCGKQALTMCMGFGCNAAGVVGCRIMRSTRERLIAIVTNCFVPCNGRFPLLITISTIFFAGLIGGVGGSIVSTLIVLGVVAFGVLLTLIVSKVLSMTLLKGESKGFILELPPYRKPQIGSILVRSIFDRTLFVLGRALCTAVPAGLIIWVLANVQIDGESMLAYIAYFFDPLARVMGLDGYILTAFVFGIPANEIVLPILLMMYMKNGVLVDISDYWQIGNVLIENGWTMLTAINVMFFTLLHFPCMTTLLTIKKETKSSKWVAISFLVPTVCGVVVCMVTNFLYVVVSSL